VTDEVCHAGRAGSYSQFATLPWRQVQLDYQQPSGRRYSHSRRLLGAASSIQRS